MTKIYYLSVIVIAAVTFFIFQKTEIEKPETEFGENVSGAYEALTFFGEARAYPEKSLPPEGFNAAWESAQRMDEATAVNRDTDPWETMGPHNRGGRTLNLAFNPQNPSTLYAGSASGGLWRSYTAGIGIDAWERVETGHPVLGVSMIEFVPGDSTQMFIGTGEVYNAVAAGTGAAYRNTRGSYGIGILRSQDGGETWTKSLDFSYDQNKGVWDIEIAPSDHNIIYAGTTDGVYKSTDGGDNWNLVLDVVMANDIAVHPSDADLVVVGCGNFGSQGFGIYRTTNGGGQWNKISSGLPSSYLGKIQLAVAPSSPDIIYASIGNGFSSAEGASWLCRSENFGQTWSIQTQTDYSKWQGWFSHDVIVNPIFPDQLIVIGIDVWKSLNAGQSLTQVSTGGVGFVNPPIEGPDGNPTFVHSDCHDVIYDPTNPSIIYVASDGGIHRSTDGGQTFSSCNGRYQTAQFYNGFSNSAQNTDLCMGGLQDNGTIRWNGESTAVTWTRVNGGDGSWSAINQQDDNFQYVSSQNLNVRMSTNGAGFASAGIPSVWPTAFIAPFVVAPSDGSVVYAGSSVIAKSTDFGQTGTWTTTNNGNQLDGNPALSMSMSSTNTDVVYVATAPYFGNPAGVFVTTNGGQNWVDITSNLPDRFPMDLQVDPSDDAVAYITYSGFGTGHVYRTTNYGDSWDDITNGLPDVPTNAVEVDPLFPDHIYVGNDIGLFVSTDSGENWETYHDGLPEAVMVFDLKISAANRKLRAATHGIGAFQRDLLGDPSTNTAELESANAELGLHLYPNPVSTDLNISFRLSANNNVDIQLLDSQGRVVESISEYNLAVGEHRKTVDVSNLAAGIYYCKINMGGVKGVKKFSVQ